MAFSENLNLGNISSVICSDLEVESILLVFFIVLNQYFGVFCLCFLILLFHAILWRYHVDIILLFYSMFWRYFLLKLFVGIFFKAVFTERALNWSTFDLIFSKNGYYNTANENEANICNLRTLLSLLFRKSLKSLYFRTKIIQVSLKCRICLTGLNVVLYFYIKC